MKKLLVSLAAVAAMGTSLFGYTGTVAGIYTNSNGQAKASFNKADGSVSGGWPVVGTVEAQKNMLAVLLTAKSTGATVEYVIGNFEGQTGWVQINLQ